ncbi:DUF6660 family protein [Sphingobacterium spiritivorum]|uniref:DUF6660 family protein n=1 Tax=Sphingobacterium spiritivorum TaxID=258 RepID=UPI003DA5EF68
MKIFVFIFSVYMLGMSILPCTDALYECTANNNQLVEIGLSHEDNHKTEHKDFCSPFCSCQCCGTITVAISDFNITEVVSPKLKLNAKQKVSLRNVNLIPNTPGAYGNRQRLMFKK